MMQAKASTSFGLSTAPTVCGAMPFAGALCYEFLELTGAGRSVPAAVAMASVLGVSVLLLVSLTACTVPTLRALRIAPVDALRAER